MLNFLSRKSRGDKSPHRVRPRVADGKRIYAIGDIHGCSHLLEEMMQLIRLDCEHYRGECWTIFLGDYVNRGPSSHQVLQRLSQMAMEPRHVFLMGNHEEVLLNIINGKENLVKFFLSMGGKETLLSYGMSHEQLKIYTFNDIYQYIKSSIPEFHINFLKSLYNQFFIDDYMFVHAGIDLNKPAVEQDPGVTRWIRAGFVDRDFEYEKTVVHGHTIFDNVTLGRFRIGIDTGAYQSGRLSALILEGYDQRILQTGRETIQIQ